MKQVIFFQVKSHQELDAPFLDRRSFRPLLAIFPTVLGHVTAREVVAAGGKERTCYNLPGPAELPHSATNSRILE